MKCEPMFSNITVNPRQLTQIASRVRQEEELVQERKLFEVEAWFVTHKINQTKSGMR